MFKTIVIGGLIIEALALTPMLVEAKSVKKHHRPPAHYYYYDHHSFKAAGKGFIYKECPIDLNQDPGEAACKTWWAAI